MKALFTDHDLLDISLEREIFRDAGIELVEAQCRTEDEVIRASEGCSALLIQYAPVTDRVFAERPGIGLCSRIGAGYDTIDAVAAARHGVWVANSPDYGVGEVATHALGLALAALRNIVAHHRDIAAGTWHYLSSGRLRRPREMTLGIVGLGRIGKRMAQISRDVFRRVVAYDPYLIDGDFPVFVERVHSLDALAQVADVASLHTPLTKETRGMIGAGFFAAMQRGSYLVNTEPPDPSSPLVEAFRMQPSWAAGRIILSPHAAFYSPQSWREMREKAAATARDLLTKGWLRNCVNQAHLAAGGLRPPSKPD